MSHPSELFRPGEPAPGFTLPTQKGDMRSLAEYVARGPVLLAFHRGTW
jgi:peroxiredoxin